MQAGALNKRIDIKRQGSVKDTYGQKIGAWVTFREVWASIKTPSGREFMQGLAVQSEVTHIITVRYILGIKSNMRVYFGVKVFEILYVLPDEEKKRSATLYCKEVFSTG